MNLLKLVFISFILEIHFARYAMFHWLEGFAYKITLNWWIFALAGLLAVGNALLTVSCSVGKRLRRILWIV